MAEIFTADQLTQAYGAPQGVSKPATPTTPVQTTKSGKPMAFRGGTDVQKLGKDLGSFFGGDVIGESLGTNYAKRKFERDYADLKETDPKTYEMVLNTTFQQPTNKQIAGDVGQIALEFLPVGKIAKGLSKVAKLTKLKKGTDALGNIATGAGVGYGFDVSQGLKEQEEDPYKAGVGTALGTILPGGIETYSAGMRLLKSKGKDAAPRIINSLIKPLKKDFAFGKDPGRGVAEEGIVAGNMEELKSKIDERVQHYGQLIGKASKDATEMGAKVSIPEFTKPIDDAITEAMQAPRSNRAIIERLMDVKADLLKETTLADGSMLNLRKLEDLTPEELFQIKQDVKDLTRWTDNQSADTVVNRALRKMYGDTQETLNKTLEEYGFEGIRDINERYADLVTASKSTEYRDKILQRQNIISLGAKSTGFLTAMTDLVASGGTAIGAILKGVTLGMLDQYMSAPGFKTRFAKAIGEMRQPTLEKLIEESPAVRSWLTRTLQESSNTPGDVLADKADEVFSKSKNILNKEGSEGGFIDLNPQKKNEVPYKGEKDLTTKILKDLEDKTTVSKQYILDATNRGELKQQERDLFRELLKGEKDTINVSDFANKVKAELLPLKATQTKGIAGMEELAEDIGSRYENITLPNELRGNVENYAERIYESPIATSAGDVHFNYNGIENYFGHTRIEDMADNKTRRVIEVQSDLYQKGNLAKESEKYNKGLSVKDPASIAQDEAIAKAYADESLTQEQRQLAIKKAQKEFAEAAERINAPFKQKRALEIEKLQQYSNPTAHFRMVREEIKKAAQDGKTKLQFPTGETAMRIEGLGDSESWYYPVDTNDVNELVNPKYLEVGQEIINSSYENDPRSIWIVTDIIEEGKFKAIPKSEVDKVGSLDRLNRMFAGNREADINRMKETFDISGKVDTNNPIYKFYEKDLQKYLNKFGGKRITDDLGVEWIEVPIKKEWAKMPVEAFALLPGLTTKSNDSNKKKDK